MKDKEVNTLESCLGCILCFAGMLFVLVTLVLLTFFIVL